MNPTGSGSVLSSFGEGESRASMPDAKVAIYARTSSVNQKFGYSLEEQIRQCWERAKVMDWEVTHVFRDEAESGKDEDRPMYQQMLSAAEGSEFNVVVFWKLDRLSRSIMHVVQLEARLRELGISLYSITEQLDTTTPSGRFSFRSLANAAELERELIKQRSRMGLKGLAMEHKWPNDHPPLGYEKLGSGKLAIQEEEADFVRRIFDMYIYERSMPEVAKRLNSSGDRTKAGNSWCSRAVSDILRNQLYIGVYSVAGVEEYVEEYHLLKKEIFDTVRKIRHRFQAEKKADRKPMPADRKALQVDTITDDYVEFLRESATSSNDE